MGDVNNRLKRHGHGTEFYTNSATKSIHKLHAYFFDNRIHDTDAEIYDEKGQPYIFGEIKNGNLIRGKIFRDGVLFYEGIFEEGKITTEYFKA